MEKINQLASKCTPAKPSDNVLNSECAFTFHSPYTNANKGIVVNCSTYVGSVEELATKDFTNDDEEGLFVRIIKQRVEKKTTDDNKKEGDDAASTAPTKLGIGVEGGFATEDDQYETITTYSVLVMKKGGGVVEEIPYNDETKSSAGYDESTIKLIDSIVLHAGMTTQQDVKAWAIDTDETIIVSKYAGSDLPFVDNGVMIDPNPSSWKCEKSGDTENLWLNLSDGYIGGGRKNWDGSGGSNGALDHFEETGCKFPLVVKLGTITADLNSADCFSYAKDEDCPVRIPNLAELLDKRGIKVANMQKTVKSTAELEVELNYNYDFNAITNAGETLENASGPGLQGLQNLGNSCYMNSVLQMLFSVPELSKRYGTNSVDVDKHPLLQSVPVKQAPTDLLCQTTKVACALTSGAFAKPADEKAADDEDKQDSSSKTVTTTSTDPKYRLAPRMFKHLIGKDHVEFRTGQQQDAAQFLQYMLEQIDRAEMKGSASIPYLKDKSEPAFHVASHLFTFQTTDRLVCGSDNKIKYKESGKETTWSLAIPMDRAVVKEEDATTAAAPDTKRAKTADGDSPSNNGNNNSKDEETKKPVPTVQFADLLEQWAAESPLDGFRWAHLQNAVHKGTTTSRLKNFPPYLILQLQRYQLGPDWQPMKLEVKLDIPQKIDLNFLRSTGPQDGETLVPPEEEGADNNAANNAGPEINEGALCQLMDMGFSMNGCKRALTAVGGSNVEAAMNWVFEHSMDPDFNDPMPEGGTGAASAAPGVDEGVVMSLVENLGCFTPDQVRAALKETSGAADRAADWLFSHMDDLDGAIAAINSRASDSAAAPEAPKLPLEDGNGEYTMIGTVSHIGKHTGSGHYVAHMKRGDRWVIFNDEKVAYCEAPPLEHAYMYLFQRNDTIGSPNPNY